MNKKNFKDSPALAFITPQDNTQYNTHEANDEYAQEDTQQIERKGYIRTQGRKGHKKPKITISIDSPQLMDEIRVYADYEGMSLTQYVNESVAHYNSHIRDKIKKYE